jgi:hypothetical protein
MSSFDGGLREFEEPNRLTRRKRDARYDKRNGTVMATADRGARKRGRVRKRRRPAHDRTPRNVRTRS